MALASIRARCARRGAVQSLPSCAIFAAAALAPHPAFAVTAAAASSSRLPMQRASSGVHSAFLSRARCVRHLHLGSASHDLRTPTSRGRSSASAGSTAGASSGASRRKSLSSSPEELQSHLQTLLHWSNDGFTLQMLEEKVQLFTDEAWTLDSLHLYLTCLCRAPSSFLAVRVFTHVVDDLHVVPTSSTFSLLVCALAKDPHVQGLEDSLTAARARMRARSPPLKFTYPQVESMHNALLAMHPDTASELMQWAREDGAWSLLNPLVQEHIAEAAATATQQQQLHPPSSHPDILRAPSSTAGSGVSSQPPVAAGSAAGIPTPLTPAQEKLASALRALHETKGDTPVTAADIESVMVECLTGPNHPLTMDSYVQLLICLLREWKWELNSTLRAMRQHMLGKKPPLRFTPEHIAQLTPFASRESTATILNQWLRQDEEWRRGKANRPTTQDVSDLARKLRSLRHNPFTSQQVEELTALSHLSDWTLSALNEYLTCYNEIPGPDRALAQFVALRDARVVTPDHMSYKLLFGCLGRGWRPEFAAVMNQLRASMLAQTPPVTLQANAGWARLLQVMLAPAGLERLARWAKSDKAVHAWNAMRLMNVPAALPRTTADVPRKEGELDKQPDPASKTADRK